MPTIIRSTLPSTPTGWISLVLRGFVVGFILFDSSIKLLKIDPVVQAFQQLGYPVSLAPSIGAMELVIVVLYAIPRTAVLGAILLTALLGGAVASHLRLGDPLFTHVLFGVYLGLVAWGGLYLRDEQLRSLVPLRTY